MSIICVHILIEHEVKDGRAIDKNVAAVYSNKEKVQAALIEAQAIAKENKCHCRIYTTQRWCVL